MNSNIYKESRHLFFIVVLTTVFVAVLSFLIYDKDYFGATELENYKETKYGDLITLCFNGDEYAELDMNGRYCLIGYGDFLSKYRNSSILKSFFKNYSIFAIPNDLENVFLRSNIPNIYNPYETFFYKSDYEFPKLKSDNIEEIKVHDDVYNIICTLKDKEMIKYFLGEKTKINYNDIISYIDDLNIKKIDENNDIYVTAKFVGSVLHYSLGLLDENEREYYEYGERDRSDDQAYLFF